MAALIAPARPYLPKLSFKLPCLEFLLRYRHTESGDPFEKVFERPQCAPLLAKPRRFSLKDGECFTDQSSLVRKTSSAFFKSNIRLHNVALFSHKRCEDSKSAFGGICLGLKFVFWNNFHPQMGCKWHPYGPQLAPVKIHPVNF